MESTTSLQVALSPDVSAFVTQQVNSGDYASASEYVSGLIVDAMCQKYREELKRLAIAGLQSGETVPLNSQEWADIRSEFEQRLAARNGE